MKNTPILQIDLKSIVSETGSGKNCWSAFSGGMDSTALLHLLKSQCDQYNMPLRAVHVNHNLHKDSAAWSKHCMEVCRHAGIDMEIISVDAKEYGKKSPEEFARELRYQKMEELLDDNDLLFLAHHREDQAETLLLQLMRGAGPEGLAAMPASRKFGKGWLVRPLLGYSKQELKEYNLLNNLEWIEDPSNQDIDIYRNYIRQNVIPLLREKWPSVVESIARAADNQADYLKILDDVARTDQGVCSDGKPAELLIDRLLTLSLPRQKNLLRFWIRLNGHAIPGSVKLQQILTELVNARPDATPCIQWKGTEIRRYKNRIFIMHPVPDTSTQKSITWNLYEPLSLPWGLLVAENTTGDGIRSSDVPDNHLEVTFRQGGESMQLPGREGSKKLKKLYQEADVPVWLRDKIPLLYSGNNLVAVAGLWIDRKFRATGQEPGWNIRFYS